MGRFHTLVTIMIWAAGSTLSGACVDDRDVGALAQPLIKCPWGGCGSNSPVIGPWSFHELDEAGSANSAGISLQALVKDGIWYQPDVVGARLVGHRPGLPKLEHEALRGAYLLVDTPDGPNRITIDHVSMELAYWVAPSETDLNETYELNVWDASGTIARGSLCQNPPNETSDYPNALEALLFTGDRYDADAITVTAASEESAGTWFNIACAGSALAKLHLNRYSTAGSNQDFQTQRQDRQAMLKMFTADVCGVGVAFTVQGTPLHWQNRDKWQVLTGSESSFEAFWDANGATCLSVHRLEKHVEFPDITDDIYATCDAAGHPLPPCAAGAGVPKWPNGSFAPLLMSANP